MIKLSEYLGGLVSNISDARALADLQTAHLAEEYSKHHLLKHFSVPRMRIQDIEITVPVAIESTSKSANTDFDTLDNQSFNKAAYRKLLDTLRFSKLPMNAYRPVTATISKQAKSLETRLKTEDTSIALHDFVRQLLDSTTETLLSERLIKKPFNEDEQKRMEDNLFENLLPELTQKPQETQLDNIGVIIDTHRLKEFERNNLVFVKMKISEEGMTWHTMEDENGAIIQKLIEE